MLFGKFFHCAKDFPLKVYSSHLNWGGETILIRSAVKHKVPGKFKNFFLMIHSHEKSIKQISAV